MSIDENFDLDQPSNLTKRQVLALMGYVILWPDDPQTAWEIANLVLAKPDLKRIPQKSQRMLEMLCSTGTLPSPEEVLGG